MSSPPTRPRPPARVAMITVHTSPLARPGTGDAGGLNVYVVEAATQLATRGIEVEIFTRATEGRQPRSVELVPGVQVRHVVAGPFDGLSKEDLPGQLCAFTAGVMREVAGHPAGYYDVVHSHYWLSGQVGWLAADRWHVPLVHTMHTMARVKNAGLAAGDRSEPRGREIGEAQVVEAADRLVSNTDLEARQLVDYYDADPGRVRVVHPGVDLGLFTPGDVAAARAAVGVDPGDLLVLFVGRVQPLKAPDLLLRAAADLRRRRPDLGSRMRVAVLGGPSGSGLERPRWLEDLAAELGIADRVVFHPPTTRETLTDWYRAADVLAMPSYNESFGLVALEAQACGTPVLAADVGGLPLAVRGGVLVRNHETSEWSRELEALLDAPDERARLADVATAHAAGFGWSRTADALVGVYGEAMASRAHRIHADGA
ncbi:D-inositol-3-phosphate glycosyltransferase [Mobilicoccus pelagius]|uniref:D-inositol-3-phosphate glycosyltransferase n=1 Tax=Mobilicoccus pelagius NBRC 104925 TaxID=1089455 RepID=H5UN56_9MICO|nr:D-inositol-3-phosphate glycosyltransferase [Mobilicoccus pelagius]GAB47164.1 glycosyltransferase MshA [Mobilicoccus pelagius NBRC 104925]